MYSSVLQEFYSELRLGGLLSSVGVGQLLGMTSFMHPTAYKGKIEDIYKLTHQRSIILGEAGAGKTSMCLNLLYRSSVRPDGGEELFPDRYVYFINLALIQKT